MLVKTRATFRATFLTTITIPKLDTEVAADRGLKSGDDVYAELVYGTSNPFRTGIAACNVYNLSGVLIAPKVPMEWAGFYSECNQAEKVWQFFIICGTKCEMPTHVVRS